MRGKKNMKVDEIILSPEKQEFLKNFLEAQKHTRSYTPHGKLKTIKRIFGGTLCSCEAIPKYLITYQYNGITKIEKYCQPCFDKVKEHEKEAEMLLTNKEILRTL